MIGTDIDHEPTADKTFSKSAAKIVEDLVLLAELHWQLFLNDTRQYGRQIVALAGTLAAAMILFVAAMVMGLAAIALILASEGLSPALACGLVALATIIVVAALLIWSWKCLRRMVRAFDHSRTEVARNVAWIKTKL